MVRQISAKVNGLNDQIRPNGVRFLTLLEEMMNDNVTHPSHYTQGKVECLDAIESAVTGLAGIDAVYTAQCIKYLWRWNWKNGLEDLLKALFYLKRLIERVEGLIKEASNE